MDLTRPESVSAAERATAPWPGVCVHTRTFWRLSRSTQTPAKGARRNVGICPAKLTVPSSSADPVRRYRPSHPVATSVIQVPISEMLWPPTKSWKLRWRSARHACDARPATRSSTPRATSCTASVPAPVVSSGAAQSRILICIRCTASDRGLVCFECFHPLNQQSARKPLLLHLSHRMGVNGQAMNLGALGIAPKVSRRYANVRGKTEGGIARGVLPVDSTSSVRR